MLTDTSRSIESSQNGPIADRSIAATRSISGSNNDGMPVTIHINDLTLQPKLLASVSYLFGTDDNMININACVCMLGEQFNL